MDILVNILSKFLLGIHLGVETLCHRAGVCSSLVGVVTRFPE